LAIAVRARSPEWTGRFTYSEGLVLRLSVGFAISTMLFAAGCGGVGGGQSATEDAHIKKLADVYVSYLAAHRGQRPADEAALKKFAKTLNPQILEVMKIDNADAIFTSPRDNQPYMVVYASKSTGPLIAYEQQGVDGKRLVATREGAVQELDESEFQALRNQK
jgi:hypothetical protein